jgi:hypothetical protein
MAMSDMRVSASFVNEGRGRQAAWDTRSCCIHIAPQKDFGDPPERSPGLH